MHKNMKSEIESAVRKMIFVNKSVSMTLFVPVFDSVPLERKSYCICTYIDFYIQVKTRTNRDLCLVLD